MRSFPIIPTLSSKLFSCGWLDLNVPFLKSIWGGNHISSSKDSLLQARVTAFMCGKSNENTKCF